MKGKLPLAWLLAAVVIGLGVVSRVSLLGDAPLSPSEARLALQAADGTEQASPFWQGGQDEEPAATSYLFPSRLLMSWFGADESTARAASAAAGIGLLLLPLLMVNRWGWPRVLLTSALLIVSPTAWVLARTVDTAVLAAFGIGLALVGLLRAEPERGPSVPLLAVGMAIGVASGQPFWMGAFGLILAFILSTALGGGRAWDRLPARPVGQGILGAAVLLFSFGSAFGTDWQMLAGAVSGPGIWLSGWAGGGYRLATAIAMLPLYEPLILVAGAAGMYFALRTSGNDRPAAFWALGALMAYLLYPGRSPDDLIWVVLPLVVLAARSGLRLLEAWGELEPAYPALLLTLVIMVVFIFAFFRWQAANAGFGLGPQDQTAQIGFAVSAIGFAVALVLLFGLGWSWSETILAGTVAVALALLAMTASAGYGLTLGRSDRRVDLWEPQVSASGLPLLEQTVQAVANAHVGRAGGLAIGATERLPANLAWSLRQQQPALIGAEVDPPPVILAPASADEPALPADYLGQAFGITRDWDWVGVLPPSFNYWLSGRRAPTRLQSWVLYVRTDVAGLDDGVSQDGLP